MTNGERSRMNTRPHPRRWRSVLLSSFVILVSSFSSAADNAPKLDPAYPFRTDFATMQDQFTMDAGHGFTYRLDEPKLGEGKLLVTKQSLPKNQPDLGTSELLVNDKTRVWKGEEQVKLRDLAVGDELLYSRTGISP